MGRTASMATATALSSLQPGRKHDEMAQRVIRMFKTPKEHATYLTSVKFARDMLRLCARAGPIFENEPRCLFIQSPVYVFGDIHGNLEVRYVGGGRVGSFHLIQRYHVCKRKMLALRLLVGLDGGASLPWVCGGWTGRGKACPAKCQRSTCVQP